MKKYVFLVLVAFVAFAFTACDKSKDKNNPDDPTTSGEISENGIKNEFGVGRLIIGGWYPSDYNVSQNKMIRYFFYSDGESETDAFKYYNRYEGYWSYNPETKVLSSTMGLIGAWQINILNAYAIQAVSVSNQTSYSLLREIDLYGKMRYVDNNPKLIIGRWQTKDKSATFEFTLDKYKYIKGDLEKSGAYKINYVKTEERYHYVNNGDVVITFDGSSRYNLYNLSGGYLWIDSLEGSNQPKDYIGEFYYVSGN